MSKYQPPRFFKCTRGVFAVEIALMAPIILILGIAVYDFSLVIQNKMSVQNAAKIGTQYGLIRRPVQGDLQPVIDTVKNTLQQSLSTSADLSTIQINASLNCECSVSGTVSCSLSCPANEQKQTYLSVGVSVNHRIMFQYPAIDPTITLADQSLVRLQ